MSKMARNRLYWQLSLLSVFACICCCQSAGLLPQSSVCNRRQTTIDGLVSQKNSTFHNFYAFDKEKLTGTQIVWANSKSQIEDDRETLIVVMYDSTALWDGSTPRFPQSVKPSVVYKSDNAGRTYTNITSLVSNSRFFVHTMTSNPRDPLHIIIYGRDAVMNGRVWYTTDGGATWHSNTDITSLELDGTFQFASHEDVPSNFVLAYNDIEKGLYISSDGGGTFRSLGRNVHVYSWGRSVDSPGTVYRLIDDNAGSYLLQRSVNTLDVKSWQTIASRVYNFIVVGHFLYYSVVLDENHTGERALYVYSRNNSGSDVTLRVNLPTATPDRFFSVLDVDTEQAFVHVDEPGKTGRGTLYVSDSSGAIFSESLRNHFYDDSDMRTRVHDFAKVRSMRGVYVTSVLLQNDSFATRITFNRGAEWSPVPKPVNANCSAVLDHSDDAASEPCALHLSLQYAVQYGVDAILPLSNGNAPGLVVAHGHTDRVVQNLSPDVYLTINGGYDWRLVLPGTHHYSLSNSGSVITAVPWNEPTLLRYSLDYGQCWHEFSFANLHPNNDFKVVGFVPEPGVRALSVVIWGYSQTNNTWAVHVFDFEAMLLRPCTASDYETWTAHTNGPAQSQGCLLGLRETFYRPKIDSWCSNDQSHNHTSQSVRCDCTMDDYDCEYGHYRPTTSAECVLLPGLKEVEVCVSNELERVVSSYRKIPGDACVGGFVPPTSLSYIDLRQRCEEFRRTGVTLPSVERLADPNQPATVTSDVRQQAETLVASRGRSVLLAIMFCLLGLLVLVSLALLYRTMMRRRFIRHRGAYKYRPVSANDRGNDEQSARLMDDDTDEPEFDRVGISSGTNVRVQLHAADRTGRGSSQLRPKVRDGSSDNSSDNDDTLLSLDGGTAATNNLNSTIHDLETDAALNILGSTSDQSALLREIDV